MARRVFRHETDSDIATGPVYAALMNPFLTQMELHVLNETLKLLDAVISLRGSVAFPALRLFPVHEFGDTQVPNRVMQAVLRAVEANDTNSVVDDDDDDDQPGWREPIIHFVDWGLRLSGKTHVRELAVMNVGTGALPFKVVVETRLTRD